jgi:integrase
MGKKLSKKKLPSGLQFNGSTYVIDKVVNGTRIKKRLSSSTLQEALEEYAAEISNVKNGRFVTKAASSLTVNDVLTHYHDTHLVNIKSGINARYHIPALSRHLGFKAILSLRRSDIDLYKTYRLKEYKTLHNGDKVFISPRTLQAELQHLSMATNRSVDDEMIPRNPIARFCKVSVPRRKKVVLDHGIEFGPEWIHLYKNLPDQWRFFFLVCYETGMRPAEVAAMQTSWVTFVTQNDLMIQVPPDQEKTNFNDRRIPVSDILKKRLLPVLGKRDKALFTSYRYDKAFRKAVKKAGLNADVTAYALRRTRATIWDAIDSQAARVALGHVPLDPHEESYVEITNERLFKLVNVNIKQKLRLFKTA